jgi:hypothetical protein
MTMMNVIAQNDRGVFLAKRGHNKCNGGTGIQGYQSVAGKRIPILCSCAKFAPKKEGAKDETVR